MPLRSFVALLAFLFAIPLAGGTFQPMDEARFWADADLDLNFVRKFISNKFCHRDPERLRSCIAGLKFAARNLNLETRPEFSLLIAGEPQWRNINFDELLTVIDVKANFASKSMLYGRLVSEQLRTFDSHAQILPLKIYRSVLGQVQKDFFGIGIETESTGAGLFVRRVETFSPAGRAGIQVNDRILRIEDQMVPSGPLAKNALALLNAKPGTLIRLDVLRDRQESLRFNVRVAALRVKDVEFDAINLKDKHIVIVRIRRFSDGVCKTFENTVEELKTTSGLILDLRNNPGGILREALCLASLLLAHQVRIQKQKIRSSIPQEFGFELSPYMGEQIYRTLSSRGRLSDLPVSVLVSAATKSAAEVLASLLQEQRRSWIIGERTFGKGTTQLVSLVPFNSKLRLTYTIARYQRPDGSSFQLNGVIPNFSVPFRFGATSAERRFWREEDLEPNALESGSALNWSETRPREVQRIKRCISQRQAKFSAAEKYKFKDYQKAFALDLMFCK